MVEWLKKLVIGDSNVVLERSYTNWNKLDVSAVIAEKEGAKPSATQNTPTPPTTPAPTSDKKTR